VALNRVESSKPFEPVIRARVMERLANAFTHRIAFVIAPAGFGKSVAVRHYLDSVEIDHVRYALRGEHATLLGFARGLAEALQPVVPGAIRSVAEAYEKASASETPAMDLAMWAHAQIKQYHGTIVIDDFHEAVDPSISKFVAELIERTEETTRWIIVTRETLQLPVAIWFAYGRMDAPVDEGDLKITLEEATELVESSGVSIRREDMLQLLELTEGWPVAFTFALRSSMRTGDFQRVTAGTRMLVYDYLAEQVFSRLSKEERGFLLDTCVFSTIDVRQLVRNGWPQAPVMIEELRKHTAFVSVENERTYRYHELFRQYLLRDLENSGAENLSAKQLAAAAIYEKEGDFSRALVLYTKAKRDERVINIIEQVGFHLLEEGRSDIVEAALASLQDMVRRENAAALALRAAMESAMGNFDRSDACYEEALRLVSNDGIKSQIVQKYVLDLLMRFEYTKGISLFESYGFDIFSEAKIRARMFSLLAAAYSFMSRKKNAEALMEKAMSIAATMDDEEVVGFVKHQAGHLHCYRGEYDAAEACEKVVMDIAKRNGLDGLAARALSILVDVSLGRGDLAQGKLFLQQMVMYAERAGNGSAQMHGISILYEMEVERGDYEGCAELEKKIVQFDARASASVRASGPLLSSFALQAAWNADFPASLQIVNNTAEKYPRPSLRAFRWSEIALYAAGAGERETAEAAVSHVTTELQVAEEEGGILPDQAYHARLYLALTQLLLGRTASANAILRRFESEHLKYHPLIKGLLGGVRALYVHLETGVGEADVTRSLEVLQGSGYGGYARLFASLPFPAQAKLSPFGLLTKTELVILRALADGNSSKGIGQEMERSSLTIDSHVKSIVRKLQCKGRREAVSLARRHGIV
jgi:ATP/maltotriose-dependent transcriptional regulator MalT